MEDDDLSLNSKYLRIWRCLHSLSPQNVKIALCAFAPSQPQSGSCESHDPCSQPALLSFADGEFVALSSGQAIRNLVCTVVSGNRRTIDIVSSEYANLAPQSQHTL